MSVTDDCYFQTNDLTAVHLGVKFSCRFTLREIQERWYAILYDPILSKWVSLPNSVLIVHLQIGSFLI